nr:MAG TPA: hypothetical protein [Caudoviricetes sp.]
MFFYFEPYIDSYLAPLGATYQSILENFTFL